MRKIAWIVLILVAVAGLIRAQTTEDIRKTVQGTVDVEKETQRERDDWAVEQAELEARYRTAQANIRYLTQRNANEEKKVAGLEESIGELERRMREAKVLQASLQDTLDANTARFEEFVRSDLPFLHGERKRRLNDLKREIARPEATGAEKLRRLLEAMQVETEYGKTVEVNQEEIEIDGSPIFVDVLRVGRLSLFWRTPDGEKAGTFDRATWSWVELPARYNRTIGEAMDMASRVIPVQLIDLPLGRIQP
jgi:hypothetical protein